MEREDAGPRDGETIETDLCIVGAGPAGLAIASTLAGGGRTVLLLESGGRTADEAASVLNDGSATGDGYAGLRETRHRQVGGTAAIWNTRTHSGVGAKFTPLDPIDFETRQAVAHTGWPLSFHQLVPWYIRAQELCGLGRFDYTGALRTRTTGAPLTELPGVESRVYHFGTRDALLDPMLRAVRAGSNVRLVPDATVVRLETDRTGAHAIRARVASRRGSAWWVAANEFILCGGAIENARLLLCSGNDAGGLGNRSGWVGRCFMEHPRDRTLSLRAVGREGYRRLGFYDVHGAGDTEVAGRLAIAERTLREENLLNASATLLPIVREPARYMRDILGPFGRRAPFDQLLPRGGFGWSRHRMPTAVFEGFTVLLNLEQAPDPENRITLARDRDAFGVPRAELHWRWRLADERSRLRVRATFAAALEGAGVGVVRQREGEVDPNAHHHAGTTRMHSDPALGVVNADCRVHDLENVHIAGASVFPTAGFANPALTIIAMALRLADHLDVRR
jgi:choline dehydrogenase-like flavoprotein